MVSVSGSSISLSQTPEITAFSPVKSRDYKLTWTDSKNIGVGLSGKYTFTLDPDGGTNNILSYTFERSVGIVGKRICARSLNGVGNCPAAHAAEQIINGFRLGIFDFSVANRNQRNVRSYRCGRLLHNRRNGFGLA